MKQTIEFNRELVKRYDVQGPRYTSYPTAVQFTEDFGLKDYRHHAHVSNEVPIPDPLSVYIHIPFCRSPCFYCACTKIITRDSAKAEAYLQGLYREIAMQAALFDPDRSVDQLHLGGGTPTFLGLRQLSELMSTLDKHFNLREDEGREFSIEIDPRTVSEETIALLAGLGFNRMSVGVQDFAPEVQQAVNRVQPEDDTVAVMEQARHYGFESVSVDLIYGLPFQTETGFDNTIGSVIQAKPDRIAVYSYAHLPQLFKPQRQIKAEDLPTPEVKLELLRLTIEKLTAAGYVYIGMDHFALPDDELVIAQRKGTLQRNFQGYSTHAQTDLIGLGVSAIGKIGDSYSQNLKSLPDYYSALDAGQLPIWRGLELNADDILRREVIQQIMCQGELDYSKVGSRFQIQFKDYFADELTRLEPLREDGLVKLEPGRLEVTPAGRLLLRAVAMVFDAYLNKNGNVERFSKVI